MTDHTGANHWAGTSFRCKACRSTCYCRALGYQCAHCELEEEARRAVADAVEADLALHEALNDGW